MTRPSVITRVRAALKGEVSVDTLEAYRRAGGAVYAQFEAAEALRRTIDPWAPAPAQASQLLATWNAYCLQTLAEQLLDADATADPGTVGFLPPVTAEQVRRLFGQVPVWLSRAAQATQNPGYDVAAELALPADLPAWVEVEPCPRAHLSAMLATAQAIRERAEAALGDLTSKVPDSHAADAARLRQAAADAATSADYARDLYGSSVDTRLHEDIEARLHHALQLYYRLGQVAAMPSLLPILDQPPVPRTFSPSTPSPAGFDQWCLTDPQTRESWKRDPAARTAISNLWRFDPDPSATLAIQHQIDAALTDGAVTRALDEYGRPLGHYFCCPWAAVLEVRHPVVIAGQRLPVGTQFAYDVSAEEMAEGGAFVRRLVTGPFARTDRVDYCDPTVGGHDDD